MAKNVIITKTARKKLVQARAGIITLPKIVGMAFGSGGIDSKGAVVPPTDNQTKLTAEMYRKKIDGYSVLSDTSIRYECTLSESELAGKSISEIGLYDAANDLVCIKTFTAKGKDDDIQMTYTLDDVF